MESAVTYDQAQTAMTIVVLVGGMALLALALSAAVHGVWSAAVFIGLAGLFLVGTVIFVKGVAWWRRIRG